MTAATGVTTAFVLPPCRRTGHGVLIGVAATKPCAAGTAAGVTAAAAGAVAAAVAGTPSTISAAATTAAPAVVRLIARSSPCGCMTGTGGGPPHDAAAAGGQVAA